jgi:hypothetical protein
MKSTHAPTPEPVTAAQPGAAAGAATVKRHRRSPEQIHADLIADFSKQRKVFEKGVEDAGLAVASANDRLTEAKVMLERFLEGIRNLA